MNGCALKSEPSLLVEMLSAGLVGDTFEENSTFPYLDKEERFEEESTN